MTDRERDSLVAEKVMGWEAVSQPLGFIAPPFTNKFWLKPDGVVIERGGFYPWSPSTDHNAAALVLKRIGELGMQRRFNEELARQIWPPDRHMSTFGGADAFAFEKLTATPVQLMNAALACVASSGELNNEKE